MRKDRHCKNTAIGIKKLCRQGFKVTAYMMTSSFQNYCSIQNLKKMALNTGFLTKYRNIDMFVLKITLQLNKISYCIEEQFYVEEIYDSPNFTSFEVQK